MASRTCSAPPSLPSARSRPLVAVVLGLLLGWASACGSDFEPPSEITSFRFLAVRAEPPSIFPGEATRLEALVAGGTATNGVWTWCPLRGPNSAQFACLVTVEQINQAIAELSPDGEPSIPPISADFFQLDLVDPNDPTTAQFRYEFPPEVVREICQQIRSQGMVSNLVTLPECDGTFPISVRVDLTNGARTITAFKDVNLVYYTTLPESEVNDNPNLEGAELRLLLGGSPVELDALPFNATYSVQLSDKEGDARALLDQLSQTYTATETRAGEDGEEIKEREPTREQLTFSWFATSGSWEDDRTGFLPETVGSPAEEISAFNEARDNEWASPSRGELPMGEPVTLYLVVRDERGGATWTSTTVTLGGPAQ